MNKNLKTALIVGGVFALALVAFSLFRGVYGWGSGGWGMMGGYGGGWVMLIFMVLVPAFFVWAIVAFARGDARSCGHDGSQGTDSALEVLRKRYARGDISKQEFEEKKKDLA